MTGVPLRPLFLLLLLVSLSCQLLGVYPAHHHHSKHWKPSEIEAEYLQWVQRVGEKSKSSQATDAQAALQPQDHDEKLSARVITVNKQGTGDFKTVQAAINSIKSGNHARVIIQIAAGVYSEKVKIPRKKPFITLQGATDGQTTITWHDNTRTAGSTFKSASVSVMSDYFIARDMTFVNTAPYPKPGSVDMQAVALQISGDKAAFYNCRFLGTQDTLYDHEGRHYFYKCFIQGSVDFIFGDGKSLYESCGLHAISKAYGSFTAQKRKAPGDDSGFSFVNCQMTGSGLLFLGRAWGPYSRVVLISSYIDAQIAPGGWYNWGIPARERTVFYGQYDCTGPGASMKGRVAWSHELTAEQAAPFMSLSFIDGEEWVQQ